MTEAEDNTTLDQCRDLSTRAFYRVAPPNVGFIVRRTADDELAFTWRFDVGNEVYTAESRMLLFPKEPYMLLQRAEHLGESLGTQAKLTMQQAYTKKHFG